MKFRLLFESVRAATIKNKELVSVLVFTGSLSAVLFKTLPKHTNAGAHKRNDWIDLNYQPGKLRSPCDPMYRIDPLGVLPGPRLGPK